MEHGHERRPTIIPQSPTIVSESTGCMVPGDPGPGAGSELLAREIRELRSALDAANAEVEETRADAIRLQGERDDALREADVARLRISSEVAAARDDEIRVQSQLDEALRMVDDGRGRASEEQWCLIEELDALRQELAEARQTGRRPGGG